MEFTLFAVLLLATAWLMTAPLRRPREHDGADLASLEAARDAKLGEIQEAEFDLRTGKLSEEDHALVDSALRAEAAALLDRLERARGPDGSGRA
jgi:hypothetical protein